MAYLGTFTRMDYTLEVATATSCALTVMHIRRDRVTEVEVLQFDAANGGGVVRTIGNTVDRVVFLASGQINSSAVIKISQGTGLYEVRVLPDVPDAMIVFDVV